MPAKCVTLCSSCACSRSPTVPDRTQRALSSTWLGHRLGGDQDVAGATPVPHRQLDRGGCKPHDRPVEDCHTDRMRRWSRSTSRDLAAPGRGSSTGHLWPKQTGDYAAGRSCSDVTHFAGTHARIGAFLHATIAQADGRSLEPLGMALPSTARGAAIPLCQERPDISYGDRRADRRNYSADCRSICAIFHSPSTLRNV